MTVVLNCVPIYVTTCMPVSRGKGCFSESTPAERLC